MTAMAPEMSLAVPNAVPIPKLTTRRQVLLAELANGKSMSEATATAKMQRESGYRAIDEMRERLPELMDGVGLDVRSILCRIREKCDAHETKFFQFEGKVTERVDVEAHGVQLKALELAVSLRPELAKPETTHIGTVNVLFAGALPDWTVQAGDGNKVVHTGDSEGNAPPPLSAVEGTGPDAPACAHTNSATVGGPSCVNTLGPNAGVPVAAVPVVSVPAKSKLSSRVVKKRVARLPVYRGNE